jgi:ferrous iron transport protein A
MAHPADLIQLSKLREGETAIIDSLEPGDLSLKLLEMGLLPGEAIKMDKVAPLGDPLSVKIGSYLLSIRKNEAKHVYVRKLKDGVK